MTDWNPTPDQLLCRDIRHSWQPYDAWETRKGFVRVLRCSRCRSQRIEELDREGYVVSKRMKYPQGYLRKDGGRLTKKETALIRRHNTSTPAQDPLPDMEVR